MKIKLLYFLKTKRYIQEIYKEINLNNKKYVYFICNE